MSSRTSGFAEARAFGYLSRTAERDPFLVGWATLFVKEEARLGPLRLTASVRAQAITSRERGPLAFDPADRELRRSPLSLRELTLRLPLASAVDLVAGRFELGWGKTDGYSPADAFLPRDLSDPYADEKLPVWGLRLAGQRGPVRFDLVGVAVTTPWRLPALDGRNAPAPSPLAYFVDGQSRAPRDGFLALRLLGSFGDWDVGLWGRTGVRPAPLLVFRTDQLQVRPDGVAVPADRAFARESGAGLEASRVLGSFLVRAELAALTSSDERLGDALVWTVGAERAFGDGSLLVTLAANARGTPVDPLLLFDRATLPAAIAIWSRQERWGSWRVVLSSSLSHGDGLVKAEVAWNATDVWRLALGTDLVYGSSAGPYGSRPDTKRLHASLRRSW